LPQLGMTKREVAERFTAFGGSARMLFNPWQHTYDDRGPASEG
jgi:hypothetical protein